MFLLFNNTSQSLEPWDLYNVSGGNLSESEYDTEDGPPFGPVERIFIIITLAVIIFFSIFGNILVVVAVLTDRKLRKPSNHFIISLAVADLLVAVLVMTFAVANDIVGHWIFHKVFCNVWISFDIMCSTASILNLCAISFDRYTHIRNPLRYEMVMTSKRIFIILGVIWVVSALISFVPLQLGWHRLGLGEETPKDPDKKFQCILELNPYYAVFSSSISFYLPCLIMITIYIKLFQYARRQVKSIKRTCIGSLNNGSPDSKHSQYKVSDHKAAITLGVIMGTFLLCWLPFFTINIVGAFCKDCISPLTFVIVTWLGYFNSTLNPVIYSIFNQEFREAFQKVLSFEKCVKLRDIDFKVSRTLRHGAPIRNAEYGALSQKASEEKDLQDHITSV